MESMLGSRRRSIKEISVLHWRFRKNCLSPSSGHSGRNLIDFLLQDNVKFRTDPSIVFTILDVHSIFILLSTMDWYLEVRIQARHKQCSFCLLILETESTRILKILTWMYHVMHNTCITHRRNVKTRYIGSMLILQFGKDWHSIKLDRMQSSFKEYFQLIVFQKLDWRLEKSYLKKHTCHLDYHQRSRKELSSKVNRQP